MPEQNKTYENEDNDQPKSKVNLYISSKTKNKQINGPDSIFAKVNEISMVYRDGWDDEEIDI